MTTELQRRYFFAMDIYFVTIGPVFKIASTLCSHVTIALLPSKALKWNWTTIISCISHVAKVLEKVIHQQLIYIKDHLFDHHFITKDQSAYRSGYSTETALHRVVIDLLNGANEDLVSGVYFLT